MKIGVTRGRIHFPVAISPKTFVELSSGGQGDGPKLKGQVVGGTTNTLLAAGGASVCVGGLNETNPGVYMCTIRFQGSGGLGDVISLAALLAIRRTDLSSAEVVVFGQPICSELISTDMSASSSGKTLDLNLFGEFGPLAQANMGRLLSTGTSVELGGLVLLRSFDRVHSVGGNWLVQRPCYLAEDADRYFRREQRPTPELLKGWKRQAFQILDKNGFEVGNNDIHRERITPMRPTPLASEIRTSGPPASELFFRKHRAML
jgi:hypothetical protein